MRILINSLAAVLLFILLSAMIDWIDTLNTFKQGQASPTLQYERCMQAFEGTPEALTCKELK